jgi:hypothetical protein
MKKLILTMMILFSGINYADDYETAQRFQEGDTVSAEVLNDILDRMELALKTTTSVDLVGTWDLVQTTCAGNGGLGNCSDIDGTTGFGTNQDNLYKQRSDTVIFSDDGDGTYSLSQANYCAFVRSGTGNSSCVLSYAVVDGRFIFNSSGYTAYSLQRVSDTRYLLAINASGSGSFNIIRLDKRDQPPKAPKGLAISLSGGIATLTWTAGAANETGYDIQRKASSNGTYASIGTSTTESYEDSTIAKNNSYWYRVFATNADGSSIGTGVIQITYSNTPPSMNLSSTVSVNEGTTSVVTIGATDADGDSLTYTISNLNASTDAEDLSVSSEGVITFNASPDWEIPTDYNTDNIYDIRVSVSDGTDTVSQNISVVVLDVDDS